MSAIILVVLIFLIFIGRDMGHLYYLRDGKLMAASLPTDDFRYKDYFNMSEKRFLELEKLSKEQDAFEDEINLQSRITKRRTSKMIIDAAPKKNSEKNNVSDIRESRKEEKEVISGNNSIAERFDQQIEILDYDEDDYF